MKTKDIKNNILSILKLPAVYLASLLVYLESVFHIVRFGFSGLLYPILYGIFFGLIVGLFVNAFPELVCKILTYIFSIIFSVFFIAEIIYSGVFSTYLSLTGTMDVAGQALDFTDVIFSEAKKEWWILLLILIPVVYLFILGRKIINFDRGTFLPEYCFLIVSIIIMFIIIKLSLSTGKGKLYSAYELKKNYTSVDMCTEKLGVVDTFLLDFTDHFLEKYNLRRKKTTFMQEAVTTESTTEISTTEKKDNSTDIAEEEVIDTSPNVLEIDFDELIENESNSNIIALHEYIKNQEPTNKNEYTGMFEGYNLAFVVAEGFSGYSVDKKRTPTLYKMIHEGFYFTNYYTPLWYGSTVGGEYADLTGLIPKNGGYLSMCKSGSNKNDMRFTLSRQLKEKGYNVMGFHANDYTYYDRNISHPNLGYEWVGVGNGYEPERDSSNTQLWPQSDDRLIETTIDEVISKEPFHVYYLTVSGHVMYNWGGNAMCAKHKDIVENLDYSETTKAYLACQYELELAMTRLLDELEKAGIADNTLIVLTADHVPYDNKEVVDELAGKTLDPVFDWYKNALVIYSTSMEEPVLVTKYCSSIDILPTVSNLMGLKYDSRMLVGQDILSDCEGLVMFNDRSFITDKVKYNANTGEVTNLSKTSSVSDEYIENMKVIVANKFNMSQSICDYDYYHYVYENALPVNVKHDTK